MRSEPQIEEVWFWIRMDPTKLANALLRSGKMVTKSSGEGNKKCEVKVVLWHKNARMMHRKSDVSSETILEIQLPESAEVPPGVNHQCGLP